MAITRRTPMFGQVATQVEELLGPDSRIDPDTVDAATNARVDTVAALMGITPRSALLAYAPDTLPTIVADDLAATPQG